MTLDTTRLVLPYPEDDDAADVPADIQALADRLDLIGAWDDQGTFAARPAAGKRGRYYFATDTSKLYRDNGSAWVEIAPTVGTASGTVAAGNDARIVAASAALGTWRTLFHASCVLTPALTMLADYVMQSQGTPLKVTYSGTTGDPVDTAGASPALFHYDPAAYAISGKTAKHRMVGHAFTDAEASGNQASVEVIHMEAPVAGKWSLSSAFYSGPGQTFGPLGANGMDVESAGAELNGPGTIRALAFHVVPGLVAASSVMYLHVALQQRWV